VIIFHNITWKNFLSTGNTPISINLKEAPTTLIKKSKETEYDKFQREIKELERDEENIPELLRIKTEEKILKDLTKNIKY